MPNVYIYIYRCPYIGAHAILAQAHSGSFSIQWLVFPVMVSHYSLDTALPRDAGTRWRPCEAETVEKISHSKARRLRDRRVAVRKALCKTTALRADIPFLATREASSTREAAHSLVDRISVIEFMIADMHWWFLGQFQQSGGCGATDAPD